MSYVFKRLKSTFGGGERKANCNFLASIGSQGYWKSWERGGEIPPTFGPSGGGEISPGGEIPPPFWHCDGGRNPPQGRISLPLENMFTKNVWTLFVCTAHKLDNPPALNHSCVLNLEWSQSENMMFLTLNIEKISKKLMVKTVKN